MSDPSNDTITLETALTQTTPEALPLVPVDQKTLSIVFFGGAALLALILILITRRKSKSKQGTALLLVGAQDAGKTSIFSSLVYNQMMPTHTSIQSNSSFASVPEIKNPIPIYDIPGHPRIRGQFADHLNNAKAIAFVVDASTVSRNGPAVAEHLHQVMHALTSLPPSQSAPSLVILAHKTDLLKSSSASSTSDPNELAISRVRTVLERELEKRRSSGLGVQVEGLGDDEKGVDSSSVGGLECGGGNAIFKFAEWDGGEVTFVGTSITTKSSEKTGMRGLEKLNELLQELF